MQPGKIGETLRRAAASWASHDPDPRTRQELLVQLDQDDVLAVQGGFAHPLEFGTAGLRGAVGPGPARMNLAVVLRVSWALASFLQERAPGDRRPILIGYDARAESAGFARAAAAVHAAFGQRVWLCAAFGPTPWIAFGVRHFAARAGIVLTPSHNPRGDAGYKLYDDEGIQIVSPWDTGVAAWLERAPAASEISQDPAGVETCPNELYGAYDSWLERVATTMRGAAPARPLHAVYTPLHGVGLAVVHDAALRVGTLLEQVPEQAQPDGTFPTAPFPNPEEPGVWAPVRRACARSGLDWAFANDPDADRLALAVARRPGESIEPLSGDQLGLLLADAWLEALALPEALVVSTLVSSPGLDRVAQLHGARLERTLTGFKWLGRPALGSADFAFSYEEALGYCFGFGADKPLLDKDGIAALVAVLGLTQREMARSGPAVTPGELVVARLGRLASQIGLWTSLGHSLRFDDPGRRTEKVEALARSAPKSLGGRRVLDVVDYRNNADQRPSYQGAQDLVILELEGGARICVRPSGTEPKLKLYVHLSCAFAPGDSFADAEQRGRDEALGLAHALAAELGA